MRLASFFYWLFYAISRILKNALVARHDRFEFRCMLRNIQTCQGIQAKF